MPRGSEALFLLQRIRDESHRFAISYHRQLRGKRMTVSVLDDIPGLGEKRKQRLIKELGGVRAVRSAELEQLQALQLAAGFGRSGRVREAAHRTGLTQRRHEPSTGLGSAPRSIAT